MVYQLEMAKERDLFNILVALTLKINSALSLGWIEGPSF